MHTWVLLIVALLCRSHPLLQGSLHLGACVMKYSG